MTARLTPPGCVRGKPRTPPEVLAAREALAVALLRAGTPRREIERRTKLYGAALASVRDRHGIAKRRPARHTPPPEVRAERERLALELLRAGETRTAVIARTRLTASQVKALAEANGIAKLPSGRPPEAQNGIQITRLSYAELDALEAQVAADRAAGRLPPSVTVRTQPRRD